MVVLLAELDSTLEVLARIVRRAGLKGPAIHDARIAAICLSRGVTELLTADRGFSRFHDLAVRNPLASRQRRSLEKEEERQQCSFCMALNIKDSEADALARQLAARTGESLTEAVLNALKERLARTERAARPSLERELAAIRRRCGKLKVKDARPAEEIIGYDAHRVPR